MSVGLEDIGKGFSNMLPNHFDYAVGNNKNNFDTNFLNLKSNNKV